MTNVLILLTIMNVSFSIYLYCLFNKERRRNRVMQSFTAGIIRSISDYFSQTDAINDDYKPTSGHKLPISYKSILKNIKYEFEKDFWIEPFNKWISEDRLLFNDAKYSNDGFNFMYYDFFDRMKKEWTNTDKI